MLTQFTKSIKNIPERYLSLPLSVMDTCIKEGSTRLTKDERLLLEIEYNKRLLDKPIQELVDGLPFSGVELLIYRDKREAMTAVFGNFRVKCSKLLYDLSDNKLTRRIND
jgi:hypothetical protein